ncbi:MAG: DNA (cytosine-5-)-methyltransferase [Deferribacteraceae bacterium]|jgi:DNA (cytosine-5)-methyltransferase 1|nr:DNA (cytosine-5-)-methyltransferase [Deferribacteraceae bacterium]
MNKNLNLLSLFSGCGGMDLGFEGGFDIMGTHLSKTRFKTVFANDIKQPAKTAWSNYFTRKGLSEDIYRVDSIVDLVKKHKDSGDVFPVDIDLITGGFPCQDFSVSGKRLGLESDKCHSGKRITDDTPNGENRGHLYRWMCDVISIVKPKMFVAENVKGLVNLADVKSIIEEDFRNNGYLVVPAKVLNAADYGVAQSRERVIFFGFKKSALTVQALKALSNETITDEYCPYPLPVDGEIKLKSVLSGLQEPHESNDLSQRKHSKAKYMGAHCQGQTEVNLDGVAPTIRSEHHGNIEFRRLSKENGGRYIDELNMGLKERRLTVRECARIQTFPDDYEFVFNSDNGSVSASEAYKLIGNAVPPLFAYHIAKRIENNWSLYFGTDDR